MRGSGCGRALQAGERGERKAQRPSPLPGWPFRPSHRRVRGKPHTHRGHTGKPPLQRPGCAPPSFRNHCKHRLLFSGCPWRVWMKSNLLLEPTQGVCPLDGARDSLLEQVATVKHLLKCGSAPPPAPSTPESTRPVGQLPGTPQLIFPPSPSSRWGREAGGAGALRSRARGAHTGCGKTHSFWVSFLLLQEIFIISLSKVLVVPRRTRSWGGFLLGFLL